MKKFFYVFLGFQLFCISVAKTQSAEIIISSLGLQELSPAGQDTVVYYYQVAFDELFSGTSRTRDPLTIPEQSEVLQHFFRDKVPPSDIQVIQLVWNDKYEAFRERTLLRADAYQKALVRQKVIVDSLLLVYQPKLSQFKEQVKSAIREDRLSQLQNYWDVSLVHLREKRDEFLLHETRFTKPLSPALYNYFEYGFMLMEEVPTSYYYNLVGGKRVSIDFTGDLLLEEYYGAYEAFENALIQSLDKEGGRAHVAIPAYHSGARYQGEHTHVNALLYGLLNWY